VAVPSEQGNEPSGCKKGVEFTDQLHHQQHVQKDSAQCSDFVFVSQFRKFFEAVVQKYAFQQQETLIVDFNNQPAEA